MFYQSLDKLTLASDIADELFPRIYAPNYDGDVTLRATLRAILAPRVDKIEGRCVNVIIKGSSNIDSVGCESFMDSELMGDMPDDVLQIINYTVNSHEKDGAIDPRQKRIIELFNKRYEGFTLDEKAGAWFLQPSAGSIRILLFTNKEKRSTVVFVEDLSVRRLHTIEALIPRLFPWYFESEEDKVTPDEKGGLLRSLTSPFSDKIRDGDKELPGYTYWIEKAAEKYDFRKAKIEKYLKNFVAATLKGQRTNLERELRTVNTNIADTERRVSDLYEEKTNIQERLWGLQYREQNSDDGRLAAYFKSNSNVDIVHLENGRFRFTVYNRMEWWDEDRIRAMLKNRNSCIYSRTGMSKDEAEMFFRALFIDRTVFLRTCACYEMVLDRCEVSPVSDFGEYKEIDTRLVNPHIRHFGCIGSYAEQFRRYMVSGEYIGVIETAIASTKSVNPGDPSFDHMISDINDKRDAKIFELDDGTLLSVKEAVELLKKGELKK